MVGETREAVRRFKDNMGFQDLLQERDVICDLCGLVYTENLVGERGQTYYTTFWDSKHSWLVCIARRYLKKRNCL